MSAYILSASTVSLLPTFQRLILDCLAEEKAAQAVEPDYSKIIPSAALRRMTKVIRLGVGAAMTAADNYQLGGIIVGTGMGCYDSSLSFTRQYNEDKEGSLSPGAFILSSDNMIASQIAIMLKSNAYNITYVNRGVSFENALIDSMLLSEEQNNNVLVGGVDEHIPYFQLSDSTLNKYPEVGAGEGSTFFVLSQASEGAIVKIEHCCTTKNVYDQFDQCVNEYLGKNNLRLPDLILYGNSFIRRRCVPESILGISVYDYTQHCGIYFTNSAFGIKLGCEIISDEEKASQRGFKGARILVVNDFDEGLIGFTYLAAVR